ncbi:DUF2812 domain-containing protein [Marinococcus halotolerans]|uniref:DUF2812 domain-containing protein n=1 Tax=Marinococcus halotolerans TaxID=301092 RepID=UPI0003B43466|nr:DUF2812 domain-containing protein [Marinococcus halotolerans]
MRKKKKIIISAMPFRSYTEEKQLLQQYRQQGWQVAECSVFGYSFIPAPPADRNIRLVLSRDYHSLQRAQMAPWRLICSSPLLHVLESEPGAPPFRDAWTAPVAQEYRAKSRFWLFLLVSTILGIIALLFLLSLTPSPSAFTDFLFFLLSVIVSVTVTSFFRWLWVQFILSKAHRITRGKRR